MAVAVLVLQAFTGQGGAAGGTAEQEAARAHVGRGPDEVGDALEAEHGVVNEKRNGVDAVRGVGGARGDERGHGAGFGDSLFEDLAVFRFLVVHQGIDVDRLIFLTNAGINTSGAEERLHAERAGFVWNDGHDELTHLRIAQHFAQHAHVGHGGGDFPAVAAVVKFLEEFIVIGDERLRADTALGDIAAESFASRAEILDLYAVFGGAIERNFDTVLIVQRNAEARAKYLKLFFVQLFLLVRDVLAFAGFAEAVALDGAREDYSGAAFEVDGGFVGSIDLARIVAAETQAAQGFVGKGLD